MRKPSVTTLRRRLAANVRRLRTAAGMTQQQAADAAELDLKHYQKIEHAEKNATIQTLTKLANAFDVDPRTLLSRPPPR